MAEQTVTLKEQSDPGLFCMQSNHNIEYASDTQTGLNLFLLATTFVVF